jgi:excisionase family DNA binding protein
MSGPGLLTTAQVAERLAVHPATVRRLVAAGELKPTRLGKRTVRFRPSDVQRFIASKRGEPDDALSDGQLRAFQAKAGILARKWGVPKTQVKTAALAVVNEAHDTDFESVSECSAAEASTALDWLEERLEEAE